MKELGRMSKVISVLVPKYVEFESLGSWGRSNSMSSWCAVRMLMLSCSKMKRAMERRNAMMSGGRRTRRREMRGAGGDVCHCCCFSGMRGCRFGPGADMFIATRSLVESVIPKI